MSEHLVGVVRNMAMTNKNHGGTLPLHKHNTNDTATKLQTKVLSAVYRNTHDHVTHNRFHGFMSDGWLTLVLMVLEVLRGWAEQKPQNDNDNNNRQQQQ